MSCWYEKGGYLVYLLRKYELIPHELQCGCECVDVPFAHVRARG